MLLFNSISIGVFGGWLRHLLWFIFSNFSQIGPLKNKWQVLPTTEALPF